MKKKELGASAPNPRPRKQQRCVCGHPRNVHTPLIGCIAMVRDVPWRHCGCKVYTSSPAIARAQRPGNAGMRPGTHTAALSPGICRICEEEPATQGGLCAICAAFKVAVQGGL